MMAYILSLSTFKIKLQLHHRQTIYPCDVRVRVL